MQDVAEIAGGVMDTSVEKCVWCAYTVYTSYITAKLMEVTYIVRNLTTLHMDTICPTLNIDIYNIIT